jgi:predicted acylesterase/phospholipase RssA
MSRPARECDLVMKGGITSGVAYAGLIVELGREFRFRRIGGTSAGAIGAAVAAAAEYRRSRPGGPAGFADLLQRPIEELTTRGFMAGLLQPAPGAGTAMDVLLALLQEGRGPRARALTALGRVVVASWWVAALAAAAAAAAIWAAIDAGDALALTIAFVVLVVLLALAAGIGIPVLLTARATLRALATPANRFGLCSGRSQGERPALTDWLHRMVQAAAGLPDHAPLTFGGLAQQGIELAMIATDLGAARAVRFPAAADEAVRYRYDPVDIAALFPPAIAAHMAGGATDADGLIALPEDDLPVVVALRMSLSVPLLLASVPLYDMTPGPRPRRCWFSDGGITSNFPIQLFDAWLPRRPTFGIDLRPWPHGSGESRPPRVHLPAAGEPLTVRFSDVTGVVSMLQQIVDAAQNWRDTAQADLPGGRERVAQVNLFPGEGGLHLDMTADTLQGMVEAGREAARALVAAFDRRGVREHKRRRFRTVMRVLQVELRGLNVERRAGMPAQLAAARSLRRAAWRWRGDGVDFAAGPPPDPPVTMRIVGRI